MDLQEAILAALQPAGMCPKHSTLSTRANQEGGEAYLSAIRMLCLSYEGHCYCNLEQMTPPAMYKHNEYAKNDLLKQGGKLKAC